METYGLNYGTSANWQEHLYKFRRSHCAVMVNGSWVEVSICMCGTVHTYKILGTEKPQLPQKDISELSKEIRNHLLERVPSEPEPELVAVTV